jgi:putative ABC transport system permease protein
MLLVAIKMLLHNKARSVSTTVGIAVAFFLSAAQVGLLVGWCDTTSAIVRHTDADVWIMAQGTPAFDFAATIPRERQYQVLSVPGVAWSECMYMGWTQWQRPDGRTTFVEMVGLDDSLVGGPWKMADRTVDVVLEPHGVIVDALYAAQLGIDRLGQEVEIGYRKAVIRGVSRDVRTFTAAPFVFVSLDSAYRYEPRLRPDEATYVLARATPDVSPDELRDRIAENVPYVDVLTTRQFAIKTVKYWMLETGAGIMAIAIALVGLLVGSVIVSQSLYTMTNDHLPDYATLMAIGFSRWKLVAVVVVQSLLLGIVGLVIGSYICGRAAAVSQRTPLPLQLTPEVFGGVVVTLLGCCTLSSLMSIRSIFGINPVTVFRG